MKNIDTLRDFLDDNNIDYLELDNKIEIRRESALITFKEYKYQTNPNIIMYLGSIDCNGFSSVYSGEKIKFDYDEEFEEFEIWFINNISSQGAFCIKISKEFP